MIQVFSTECRDALSQMLEAQAQVEPIGGKGDRKPAAIQPDAPINFLQLTKLDSLMGAGDMLDISLSKALGTGRVSASDFASSKLNKVNIKKEDSPRKYIRTYFQRSESYTCSNNITTFINQYLKG